MALIMWLIMRWSCLLSYTDHVPLEAINKELSRHESKSQQAIIMELSCEESLGSQIVRHDWATELNWAERPVTPVSLEHKVPPSPHWTPFRARRWSAAAATRDSVSEADGKCPWQAPVCSWHHLSPSLGNGILYIALLVLEALQMALMWVSVETRRET